MFFVLTFAFAAIFAHHMRRSVLGRLVRVQAISLITIAIGIAGSFLGGVISMLLRGRSVGDLDLHPAGFHRGPAGERVASMMAPSVIVGADGATVLAVGSGGSKRIRTALLQVIAGAVDQARPLVDAVSAPRLHWDGAELHVEPGWDDAVVAALERRWPVRLWAQRDLYFGGVHAVAPGREAAGDPRRGGASHLGS